MSSASKRAQPAVEKSSAGEDSKLSRTSSKGAKPREEVTSPLGAARKSSKAKDGTAASPAPPGRQTSFKRPESSSPSEASSDKDDKAGGQFSITMTAAEKAAIRKQKEAEQKAQKRRAQMEVLKQKRAEEAEARKKADFDELVDSSELKTPWEVLYQCCVDRLNFISVHGDRVKEEKPEQNRRMSELSRDPHSESEEDNNSQEGEEEGDEVFYSLLSGVANGEFMRTLGTGFPVLSNISGYPEGRSKNSVRTGETAHFQVLLHKLADKGQFSIGILRPDEVPVGTSWISGPETYGKVFCINSKHCNLYNGPRMQYAVAIGADDPHEDAAADEGMPFHGSQGGEPFQDYKYNWLLNKHLKMAEGDLIDLFVDLRGKEGQLRFSINETPHRIIVTGLKRQPPPTTGEKRISVTADSESENSEEEEDTDEKKADDEAEYCLAVQMSGPGNIVRLTKADIKEYSDAGDKPESGKSGKSKKKDGSIVDDEEEEGGEEQVSRASSGQKTRPPGREGMIRPATGESLHTSDSSETSARNFTSPPGSAAAKEGLWRSSETDTDG